MTSDEDDDGNNFPSRRCNLTTFFLLPMQDAHSLCLPIWKLDLFVPASLPPSFRARTRSQSARLYESTIFISDVSRFHMKSPFYSEFDAAVILHIHQKQRFGNYFDSRYSIALFQFLIHLG